MVRVKLAALLFAALFAKGLLTSVSAQSVDSRLCAGCHSAIFQSYRQTAMGKSFFRPAAENTIEDYSKENHYYHAVSDTHYVMLRRGDQFIQRRYQIGYDGKETN